MSASQGRVVLTGAPGWLGTALARALARGAQFRAVTGEPRPVRCIVQPGADPAALDALARHAEVVVADLRDARAFAGACEGAAAVVHGAGVIHPSRIQDLYDINVTGTRHLLDEALAAGVRRFVLISSNSPAGFNAPTVALMAESDPPRPYLNYGLSKLQAEWIVNDAHRAGRIEGVVLRPCWFYGPDQPARQTRFFRMVKGGHPIVFGKGDNLRSMSYTDNVVQGVLLALAHPNAAGRTYWIADRRPYSFIEILQTIGKVLGVSVRPRYLPKVGSDVARLVDSLLQGSGLYSQDVHVAGELAQSIAVSIEAAERDLGYDPEIELEEGIRRSVAWCRSNGVQI